MRASTLQTPSLRAAFFPVALVALCVGFGPLGAQDTAPPSDTVPEARPPAFVLDPVVIVGDRELSVPPPVVTRRIERELLIRTPAENAWDLLRKTAGIEVRDPGQGPGFSANAVLRGFASDHSSEVLLVVDGVPVNFPVHGHAEGYSDWNLLFPGAIRTLRVVHGPSSPLYGDYSLGGTVEVFTYADLDGTTGGVSASSFGDVEGWVLSGFRGERSGAAGGVQLRRNEGWRDNSDFQLANGLLRGWREAGVGNRLEGGIALHGARWSSAGYLPLETFRAGDLRAAIDPTDGGEQGRALVHGRYAAGLGDGRFMHVNAWAQASTWELYLTIPGHGDHQRGERDSRTGAGLQVEGSWIQPWGELTLGTEAAVYGATYDLMATEAREVVEHQLELPGRRQSGGAYVRWRRVFDERLGLDLGGRLDALRTRNLAGQPVSGTALVVSPKLGARYLLSGSTTTMASVSRGLRSAQGVLGDPDRPPVKAWAFEAGGEHVRDQGSVDVSLFRIHVSNERMLDPVTGQVSSAGSSVRQGVEGRLRWTPQHDLRLDVGGTYTHSRMDGAFFDPHGDHGHDHDHHHDHSGHNLVLGAEAAPRISPHDLRPSFHAEPAAGDAWVPGIALWRAFVEGEWAIRPTLGVRAAARVTGPYVPFGESGVETDAYTLVDVGASARVGERFVVDLDVTNALDTVYPAYRSTGFVAPGAPRTFRIGVRLVED